MLLTRDYRLVQASFNRPVGFKKTSESSGSKPGSGWLTYQFTVGPLVYEVMLEGKRGNWEIGFGTNEILDWDKEELRRYFSQTMKKDVTPEELERLLQDIRYDQGSDLGVGNAPTVFATVLAIIKDVISHNVVKCLEFGATTEKKGRVYRRMIQTVFANWGFVPGEGGGLSVCRGN